MKPRGALIVLVFGFLAVALAEAQQTKVPRIGVLSGAFPGDDACFAALRSGLEKIGYIEGRTHVFEFRWSKGRSELFPQHAAELVKLKVDLIVSVAGPAAIAAKQATSSIPVVLASSFYPVELGVVASLGRPGGNVTGVTHFTPDLMAKRVQLLKEAVPAAARAAVLRLPGRVHDLVVRDMEAAARRLGLELQVIQVQRIEDLIGAFDAAAQSGAQVIMSTQGPFFFQNSSRIAQLALKHRLPSVSGEPGAAEAGALLFHGPDVKEGCQRAALYVDRILKGAKPADLPIEQPTRIELVVNLKTAKALGVALPQALLLRADKLIE